METHLIVHKVSVTHMITIARTMFDMILYLDLHSALEISFIIVIYLTPNCLIYVTIWLGRVVEILILLGITMKYL